MIPLRTRRPGGSIPFTSKPHAAPCRSEPAREKPKGATGRLVSRVIVTLHREQARSYGSI
ncbi:hypothetical protein EMIT0P74_120045 [Pseudomonas sp. IT-P74]